MGKITQQVIKEATKIASKEVRLPKCVRDGIVKIKSSMEKIPTAEEWLLNHKEMSKYDVASYDESGYLGVDEEALYKMMIEFAKLHVELALEEASSKVTCSEEYQYDEYDNAILIAKINRDSILNSYTLDNIK